MFFRGIGTEQNLKNALICFQRAESFLYDMVLAGDVMYRKSLEASIRGQEQVREEMAGALPEKHWRFDD